MDKDGWKKTRKYRKSEKFGFKISAQNSLQAAAKVSQELKLIGPEFTYVYSSESKDFNDF